jgi:geranylgeranyl diphosphate synthase type I
MDYIEKCRQRISRWLQELLRTRGGELEAVNPLGPQLSERLDRFARQGKMLRGAMVCLGAGLLDCAARPAEEAALAVGAAMELFQSGLLVHDDIMDRDDKRRGQPTIHRQYAGEAERRGMRDPAHQGQSLGICAGDAAFFLGFEILGGPPVPGQARAALLRLCARELSMVAVAQMQDVVWGAQPAFSGAAADPEGGVKADGEILRLYTYKTARYTFSLPLMAGALLAGCGPAPLEALARLGECLGILFQLRDDQLDLFGDERELGKPVGSDVREGKKTLLHGRLFARAPATTAARLRDIFGNPGIGDTELDFVRRQVEGLGVLSEVQELSAGYAAEARRLIEGLPRARAEEQRVLYELLRYASERTR